MVLPAQVAKLLIIPFVCMVERCWLGRVFTRPVILSMLVVVAGVAIVYAPFLLVVRCIASLQNLHNCHSACILAALHLRTAIRLPDEPRQHPFHLLGKHTPRCSAALLLFCCVEGRLGPQDGV